MIICNRGLPSMSETDSLNKLLQTGRIDRREFLLRSAGLGTALAAGSMFGANRDRADEPTSGGTLRIGTGGGSTTDVTDPRTYTDSVNRQLGYQLFNGLVEIDEKQQTVPELFESWEVKPGAKEWIFNVRKGVTFHNGKTLTTEDIIYSINLHRGSTPSAMAGPLKIIAEVKKMGDNQVQIVLETANADLAYTMADYHL